MMHGNELEVIVWWWWYLLVFYLSSGMSFLASWGFLVVILANAYNTNV
jgi:hypothetical protein